LQQSTVNSAESIFRKNGGPLKLAALCGRIASIVQSPALTSAIANKLPYLTPREGKGQGRGKEDRQRLLRSIRYSGCGRAGREEGMEGNSWWGVQTLLFPL